MRTIMILVLLAFSFGAASAESTTEDWEKYAQPTVDKFGGCAWKEVDRTWKTSAAPAAIAREAVNACLDKLEPLRSILTAAPFNSDEAQIKATLDLVEAEVHAAAVKDIETRRKK